MNKCKKLSIHFISDAELIAIAIKSKSISEIMRELKLSSGHAFYQLKLRLEKIGYLEKFTNSKPDRSNAYIFTDIDRKKGVETLRRKNQEKDYSSIPFYELSRVQRRKRILKEQNMQCSICKIEQNWNNQQLIFELDHIDGNRRNNLRENLRFLCPNCHSQTKTFRRPKTKHVSDDELLTSLKNSKNIGQALLNVNLTPKGGNYERCYKLLDSSGHLVEWYKR